MSGTKFQRTFSGAPWEKKVGYCRAIRAGNIIAVTGTTSLEADGTVHAPGDAYRQARRCLEIIEKAIRPLGAERSHIIRTRIRHRHQPVGSYRSSAWRVLLQHAARDDDGRSEGAHQLGDACRDRSGCGGAGMRMVALLRGINVGGNKKVPMPELCALATKAGLTEVRHYINSGNIVFDAGKLKTDQVAALLEKGIEKRFGFVVEVIVRTSTQWKKYAAGSPFPSAAKDRPNLLHLGLCKDRCNKDIATQLIEHAFFGEKIKLIGDAIWVDFAGGAGKSKLTPALFDKAAGSTVTMRNWNTVHKLGAMLRGET